MKNKTAAQKALPMSLQCNDNHISHFTDPVRTFIYRKGSLEGKQSVSTVHTSFMVWRQITIPMKLAF